MKCTATAWLSLAHGGWGLRGDKGLNLKPQATFTRVCLKMIETKVFTA